MFRLYFVTPFPISRFLGVFLGVTMVASPAFGAADLIPNNVTVTSGISPGSLVAVSYSVRNQGDIDAPASHTRVQIKNKTGTVLASQTFATAAVTANTAVSETRELLIPNTVFPGNYLAYVTVDSASEVAQASTDNDTSAGANFLVLSGTAVLDADLLPLNVTVSGSPVTAGNAVSVDYLVRNQGGSGVPSTRTRVEIKDATGNTVTFQVTATPAMNPGDVIAESQFVTIPAGTPSGIYTAYVVVDVAGAVLQGATNNDVSFGTTFTVQGAIGSAADLVPENVRATSPVWAGNPVTVTYSLRNLGGTNAPASHTKVQILNYLGTEIAAQIFPTAAIAPQAAISESRSILLPLGAPGGTYVAYVMADLEHEVTQVGTATSNDTSAGAPFSVNFTLPFSVQPQPQAVPSGASLTLSAARDDQPAYQWQRNGLNLASATNASLTLVGLRPEDAGLYRSVATSGTIATGMSDPAIVGIAATTKVVGAGSEVGTDIRHANGNIFDQVLLTGPAEAITAAPGKITRTSYVDLNNDIVQVEFSGAGTLSLVLDGVPESTPPVNYNQDVAYMRGHAGIVITGANETTNLSIFAVGRATAFDPTGGYDILRAPSSSNNPANNGSPLFQGHATTVYDGVADLAYVAISSANGKFGGMRAGNAEFFATSGITGLYAPGVAFQGPVFIGDIDARDGATPTLVVGSADDLRITGGDMAQSNGNFLQVVGVTQVQFTAGLDATGRNLPAQANRAVWMLANGQDVTTQLVRRGSGADITPDAFSFVDLADTDLNSPYTSNPILVTGITNFAPIAITGGTYRINDQPFTSAPGTVTLGDQVIVRQISAASGNAKTSARLTIGDVSDAFDVTTRGGSSGGFAVRAGASVHGSLSPNGLLSVGPTGSITFTATPDNGWKLDQWLVNGVPVATTGSTYTLSNPSANTTVQATFGISFATDMTLSSGEAKTRPLAPGGVDLWTMTVNAGETLFVRVGELWGSTYFSPRVEIRDPSGSTVRVGASEGDAMATHRAAVSGTYTIAVSCPQPGEAGSYRVEAIKLPVSSVAPTGDDGGELVPGVSRTGTIVNGDIDMWTITVSGATSLVVQVDKVSGSADFSPSVRLYDPAGNIVAANNGEANTVLSYQTPTPGTYSVAVYSFTPGQTGTYRIR